MSFISGLQPLWKWGCLFEKLVSLHWWLIAPVCWVYRRWRWVCASNVALWPKAVNGGSGAWRRALRTFWPSDWLCSKDRLNRLSVSGLVVRESVPSIWMALRVPQMFEKPRMHCWKLRCSTCMVFRAFFFWDLRGQHECLLLEKRWKKGSLESSFVFFTLPYQYHNSFNSDAFVRELSRVKKLQWEVGKNITK